MNVQPILNHSTTSNEQSTGKFHVVNIDKIPTTSVNSHDETTTTNIQQSHSSIPSNTDDSASTSRFQMIRVDRTFARGRWKVNDYEPPENISTATNPPVNNIENETINISNPPISTAISASPAALTTIPSSIPPFVSADSNATSSATLAATAASAAAAAATAFQQQQRLSINNPTAVVPSANIPPPAGLLHPYPPTALTNIAAPNQSYILPNHPQFGYYPFFPPPYPPYTAQWAALAAANPYLPPPMPTPQQQTPQLPTGNLGDSIRHADSAPDITSENSTIPSNPFSNPSPDQLQNAQLAAAAAAASFIYAAQHPHSTFVSQPPPTVPSPYTTITSYHTAPLPQTIIPPSARPSALAQVIPNNINDIQQQAQIPTSPKHDTASIKTPAQQSIIPKTTATTTTTVPTKPLTTTANGGNTDVLKTTLTTAPTNQTKPLKMTANNVNTDALKPITRAPINAEFITDLLSSSPSMSNSQNSSQSLMSPITVQTSNATNLSSPNKTSTASLNDIWTYTTTGSPLNLSQAAAQTAAATAVAAMGLLNSETSQNTEIANEILKELTTPTKQNNVTDIDNKISAAMDLVKVHLLSAVREEVTELRQQIRTLNDKVNSVEHENAFLRQHISNEIYAQYTPLSVGTSSANDSSNSTTTTTTTASTTVPITSSQSISMTSASSLSSSLAQQPSVSISLQPPPPTSSSSTNLPST